MRGPLHPELSRVVTQKGQALAELWTKRKSPAAEGFTILDGAVAPPHQTAPAEAGVVVRASQPARNRARCVQP